MVSQFRPESNKVLFNNQPTMYHVLEGVGTLEIDFKTVPDWDDKLIFLDRGQYIKFIGDGFRVSRVVFDDQEVFQNQEFRVLFKHLVSVGYINFNDCADCQKYLEKSVMRNPRQILDISSKQWYWQNPFKAHEDEYHVIFDVKDVIDQRFREYLNASQIVSLVDTYNLDPHRLFSEKVGVTIKKMYTSKRHSESMKELAFSNKSVKEIAYEFGFKDPAYFNRAFSLRQGLSPNSFRENIEHTQPNQLLTDLFELIAKHHETHRQIAHYADELHVSVKTLSKNVKEELNVSIGQLIRQHITRSAKDYLMKGYPVKEVARMLHFEEPNHFSSFFKVQTGMQPSVFQNQKVQ